MMAELLPLAHSAGWFAGERDESDVVISSRVRLARNLSDYTFPHEPGVGTQDADRAETNDAAAAAQAVEETVRAELMPDVFAADSVELRPRKLDDFGARLLAERRLIDDVIPDLIFLSADESICLSVGGPDHLRIAIVEPGVQVSEALDRARKIDTTLERHLNYAVSMDLGYLSTSILNLGTSARMSILTHLPAMVQLGRLEGIQKTIRESEYELVPDEQLTADDGESALFRLFNRRTLGFAEEALASKLEDHARALVHYERQAREKLLERQGEKVGDEAHRALGILRHARYLPGDETLILLSSLRLGIVAGLVDDVAVSTVTTLLFLSRENHVRAVMHQAGEIQGTGEENIQAARATLVREALGG